MQQYGKMAYKIDDATDGQESGKFQAWVATHDGNLRQFLFSPIDDFQSTKIRDIITSRLPKMEPRIQLQNVQIIPYADQQQYEIVIDYDVESLDMYGATQRAILNNNGYAITTE